MKAVLFIAFLALGPALAEHTPVAPTFALDRTSADRTSAIDPASDADAERRALDDGRISHALPSGASWSWLCGSRS